MAKTSFFGGETNAINPQDFTELVASLDNKAAEFEVSLQAAQALTAQVQTSATNAGTSATASGGSATNAAASAQAAATSAANAAASATNAAASASSAAAAGTSGDQAAAKAAEAVSKAAEAAASAASALGSKNAAADSATTAADRATTANAAKVAAEAASTSAISAKTAAEAARDTAVMGANTVVNGITSVNGQVETVTAAKNSAQTYATAAETAYNAYRLRYQGAFSNAPSVRYDGSALLDGDLYFDTTNNPTPTMRVRSAGAWLVVASGPVSSGTGAAAFRNRIINGCFRVDTRSAFSSVVIPSASRTYVCDRWFMQKGTAGNAITGAVQYSSINGAANYSFYTNVTTGGSPPASDEFNVIGQSVEGFAVDDLLWATQTPAFMKPMVLSFRAMSNIVGTHSVAIQNFTGGRGTYTATYEIPVAGTYVDVEIPIPAPPSNLATWYNQTSMAFTVFFGLGCSGASVAPTANTWTVGAYYAAPGCVSIVDKAKNSYFRMTEVQLEVNATKKTTFEYRPVPVEVSLCERYWERSFEAPFKPAIMASQIGAHFSATGGGFLPNPMIRYRSAKRVAATVGFYSSNTANTTGVASEFTNAGVFVADRVVNASNQASTGFQAVCSTGVGGNNLRIQWTADADFN